MNIILKHFDHKFERRDFSALVKITEDGTGIALVDREELTINEAQLLVDERLHSSNTGDNQFRVFIAHLDDVEDIISKISELDSQLMGLILTSYGGLNTLPRYHHSRYRNLGIVSISEEDSDQIHNGLVNQNANSRICRFLTYLAKKQSCSRSEFTQAFYGFFEDTIGTKYLSEQERHAKLFDTFFRLSLEEPDKNTPEKARALSDIEAAKFKIEPLYG